MAQPPLERIRVMSDAVCDIKRKPYILTPQLEDVDLMQTIRRKIELPKNPAVFLVLDVDYLEMNEVELTVRAEDNVLALEAKHEYRADKRNQIFSRVLNCEWHLPEKVPYQNLQAQWTADNYLMIISTTPDLSSIIKGEDGEIKLIPQKTDEVLRPPVDMSALKDLVKDLKDKSEHALKFVQLRVGDVDSIVFADPSDGSDKPDDKPDEFKKPADVASKA